MVDYGLAASRSEPPAKPPFRETERRALADLSLEAAREWRARGGRAAARQVPAFRTVPRRVPGHSTLTRLPALAPAPRVAPAWGGSPRATLKGVTGHPRGCRDPLGLSRSLFLCMVFALKDLSIWCLCPVCCLQMFADVFCCRCRVSGPKPCPETGTGAARTPQPLAPWHPGPARGRTPQHGQSPRGEQRAR